MRRLNFWGFNLIFAISFIVVLYLTTHVDKDYEGLGAMIFLLAFLAIGVGNICVSARRFHDMGDSCLWLFLLLFPVVATLVSIKLSFVSGTYGPNRFGPDPKRPELGDSVQEETEDEGESEEAEKKRQSLENLVRESDALEGEEGSLPPA